MNRTWPALVLRAKAIDDSEELVAAVLTDFYPVAIHDLAERPLPPGGLWDPTYPPIPDPPPTPLHWNVCFNDAGERDRAADAIRSLRSAPRHRRRRSARRGLGRAVAALTDRGSRRPLTSSRRRGICPQEPVDATVIVIEPSMGFGTGHHATTRMCLRLLSEIDVSDQTVLDLGTGSGVLSMAAALRRRAPRASGIDVDRDAIGSAEASARLNTLPDTITFQVSDFRHDPPRARGPGAGESHWRNADVERAAAIAALVRRAAS